MSPTVCIVMYLSAWLTLAVWNILHWKEAAHTLSPRL